MKYPERMDLITELLQESVKKTDTIYNVQTYGTVPKTDLDTAYREGVNSYGE